MKTSTQGIEFIKGFEQLRLIGYLPTPNDKPTAGWGHTGRDVEIGVEYTPAQCQAWIIADLAWAEMAVRDTVDVPLEQFQFDALVSFVFNIGRPNFAASTLLSKLNACDYEGAAAEFKRWNKQAGKVLNGLTRRRLAETQIFLGRA